MGISPNSLLLKKSATPSRSTFAPRIRPEVKMRRCNRQRCKIPEGLATDDANAYGIHSTAPRTYSGNIFFFGIYSHVKCFPVSVHISVYLCFTWRSGPSGSYCRPAPSPQPMRQLPLFRIALVFPVSITSGNTPTVIIINLIALS